MDNENNPAFLLGGLFGHPPPPTIDRKVRAEEEALRQVYAQIFTSCFEMYKERFIKHKGAQAPHMYADIFAEDIKTVADVVFYKSLETLEANRAKFRQMALDAAMHDQMDDVLAGAVGSERDENGRGDETD